MRQRITVRLLSALPLLVCNHPGQAAAGQAADLIVRNADVYTVETSQPHATAFAISAGRYVMVGSDADLSSWRGPKTRELDLHGQRFRTSRS
jgi:hypothetical protein